MGSRANWSPEEREAIQSALRASRIGSTNPFTGCPECGAASNVPSCPGTVRSPHGCQWKPPPSDGTVEWAKRLHSFYMDNMLAIKLGREVYTWEGMPSDQKNAWIRAVESMLNWLGDSLETESKDHADRMQRMLGRGYSRLRKTR